jgi:hypothetical protein
VTQLPLEIPDLVNANRLALGLHQEDIGMVEVSHLQTGSAFITGILAPMETIESLGQVEGNQLFPDSVLPRKEVGMGDAAIPHGILEMFYLLVVSDNLLERHFASPRGVISKSD